MHSHADYVPLHLHTEYSLLDGAIKINELVRTAEQFRLPALAITDHGNIFGAIEFYRKVSKAGIKPIIGCEVYVAPDSRFNKKKAENEEKAYHLILLVRDISGYKNLMRLVSLAHIEGFYYKPRIDNDLLEQYSGGLIALSSCMKGEIPFLLLKGDIDGARRRALYYKNLFGPDNFFLELQANGIPEQAELNKKLYELASEVHLGVVATNDCHYLRREDARAHEILLCIQTNKTLKDPDRMKFQTDEFYFKSPEEMKREFDEIPEAIKNTVIIAERCNLTLELGGALLPEFKTPGDLSPEEYLERLAEDGLKERFKKSQKEIPASYINRLKEEIRMIKKMGYASYFLIVWDFIKFAKEKGIPVGPGRGSAAGSLVAWALGITEIDPIKYNLLFERFLNPERVSMPDIDVDFCRDRREEVIRYVQEKYGKDHVAQIITFGTMASRAAVRDVGRVCGIPYQEVDKIAKLIPQSVTKEIDLKTAIEMTPPLKDAYETNPQIRELLDIAMKLEGLARHASVHAAGVVIAPQPLTEYTALYKGSKGDETITTQFDLESIEKVGLLKFDFLGLDTLTIIDKTQKYIKERDPDFDINNIPLDDRETYRLLASGRTAGVFQLESSGMRELLIKMEPDRFDDLIALVALYRPGPLGSGMVEDFIKRKKGVVPVKYELPELKDILEETYGVILYQEQVMRISNRIAGFTMGQADILRRAISKKDPLLMEELKMKFIKGATGQGYPEEIAKRLFELIEYFGNYGFNKSHSAAYALVAYQTAYLKAHYPVEFMAASLTAESDKTEKVLRLINECRDMGIEVLPPDINKSEEGFTIDGKAVRFGLRAVKGVGDAAIELIKEQRNKKPFESFEDFLNRTVGVETNGTGDSSRKLNKKVIEALIKAGAFDSLGISRRDALKGLEKAQSGSVAKVTVPVSDSSIQPSMFEITEISGSRKLQLAQDSVAKVTVGENGLKDWDEAIKLAYEKEALGFYITGHPVKPFREILKTFGIKSTEELKSVAKVTVTEVRNQTPDSKPATSVIAGLILELKKHKTKGKNELMSFITLEDEEGSIEVIVFPELYKKSIALLEKGSMLVVKGNADTSEKGVKIIAEDIWDFEGFIRESLLGCSRVQLRLSSSQFERDKLLMLKDILRTKEEEMSLSEGGGSGRNMTSPFYKGIPLYIDFIMPDCTVTIQSRYSFAPDYRLLKKAQEIIGKNKLEVVL